MRRRALLVFGVAFALLFVTVAISEGLGDPNIPSGDVALVEGVSDDISAVSKAEFDRALLQKAAEDGLKRNPEPGDEKYEELRDSALGELLEAIWLEGEAEELGIEVTPKQVDAELAQIKDRNFKSEAEYGKFLRDSRFTDQDVIYRVRLQLLSNRVQEEITGQAPEASAAEIEDYYEREREAQFTTPESREARVVVNEDEAKIEDAKDKLERDNSPANWKRVAAEASEDPNTKDKGGRQAGLTRDLLQTQPDLEAAIFDSDAGVVVGPTEVAGKYFITEVVKRTPAKTQGLNEVRSQIQGQLDQELQQRFFADFASDYQSKWLSRTFCADGYLIEKCSNHIDDGRPPSAVAACYEADPKGGRPVDCPAPVQQAAPVLPGSTSEAKPDGERLPQRPRPAGLKETPAPALPGGVAPPPIAE